MPKCLPRECWDSVEQVTKPMWTWALSDPRGCLEHEHCEIPLWPGDLFHWAQEARHARKFLVSFGTRLVGSQGRIWGRGCRGKRLIEGLCWGEEDLELRYSFLSSLAREMFPERLWRSCKWMRGTRCDPGLRRPQLRGKQKR